MRIEQRVIGPCITNVYLLISEKNNAVLIDPADAADQIIQWVNDSGVTLKYIFITHGHADHVLALKEVRDTFHVPVIISKIDAERLVHPDLINDRPYVTVPFQPLSPDILIQEGDELWLDELKLRFYAMPGHTDGSMAVIVKDVIFSGDTLLKNGHGKTTLPGGDEEKLIASIRRMLGDLQGNYRVLTGHRDETTLEEAREYWNTH
ncbi:MAG: MBL fold metallo-hydrolase [Solobacterium sp.]|nr:MBL fold metallo-hydrolase [Solobacterium sp.]